MYNKYSKPNIYTFILNGTHFPSCNYFRRFISREGQLLKMFVKFSTIGGWIQIFIREVTNQRAKCYLSSRASFFSLSLDSGHQCFRRQWRIILLEEYSIRLINESLTSAGRWMPNETVGRTNGMFSGTPASVERRGNLRVGATRRRWDDNLILQAR